MKRTELNLIACASGLAGADINTSQGPLVIRNSNYLSQLIKQGLPIEWHSTIEQPHLTAEIDVKAGVRIVCEELAHQVSAILKQKRSICVIGGDHTSALGTFGGVYDALHQQGDFGLIWVDAHMDSHTPETSETGNIHGMPLASLMGYGYKELTSILTPTPKVKPDHVCVVGVRSFEPAEAEFLKRLNVRVYFMEEIKSRGFAAVMQEAVEHVNRNTIGYGLSIDIDSVDPSEAPGVDVPEPEGVSSKELCDMVSAIGVDPRLLATEIVEFDPQHDQNHITEKLVVSLVEILARANTNANYRSKG